MCEIMSLFQKRLESLKDKNRYRALSLPCGIDLTSNDYLGMAAHPALRTAAIEALEGGLEIGAAGSRLLRGHTPEHAALEAFAARHFGAGGALYFATGFQANYALFTTLPGRRDVVLYDALIHASARDGIQAGAARGIKFTHNDLDALEAMLRRHRDRAETLWIAVETLYSMDGDMAPLAEIYALAGAYDAVLIADEAHATGVYGDRGKGLAYGLAQENGYGRLVTLHTCGKAIGVAGGLVCASAEIVDYLINAARPFIYSTAPMPLQALLVRKSLEILSAEDGQARREKLLALCGVARDLFGGPGTQIVPVVLGEDARALEAACALQEAGYDVRAIRPPTVPEGTARLRLSLSCVLDNKSLHDVANILKDVS